jgi:hypothetical protein
MMVRFIAGEAPSALTRTRTEVLNPPADGTVPLIAGIESTQTQKVA